MFRLCFLTPFAAALLLTMGTAQAQNQVPQQGGGAPDLYATLRLGTTHLSSSTIDYGVGATTEMVTDSGFTFGAAVGTNVTPNIRIEGEISRAANEADQFLSIGSVDGATGDVSSFAFMANGYYDFPVVAQKISPYVTFGLGLAHVSLDNLIVANSFFANSSDTAFAWQIGGGIEYRLKPRMRLVGEYRYLGTAELSFKDAVGNGFTADYDLHAFRFGIRMMF